MHIPTVDTTEIEVLTFEEALRREVREEAGVEIEITGFVGICRNVGKDIVNIDFTAKYAGGELTTSDESTEVGWFTPEEAFSMITFPLTAKRLRNMLSGDKNAHLFCFRREPQSPLMYLIAQR